MESQEITLTKPEIQLKVISLISIWVEALLYGLYFCLFLGALSILLRRDARKSFASYVFVVGNVLMFMAISLHNALNIYRLIVAFAYQSDIRAPLVYLQDLKQWSSLASPILLAIILWIGDVMVIYWCFLIWQRKYRVIAVPSLLCAVTIGMQIVNFWWIAQQGNKARPIASRWPVLRVTFPMYLAQNIMTTGLIAFKIWSRDHRTKAAGAATSNTPWRVSLMRIVIESAAIYTASLLVMVVLRFLDHPGRLISHLIMYPIIGIVFVLLAIRVHATHEESKKPSSPSLIPSAWPLGNRGNIGVTSSNDDHLETNSSSGTKDDSASRGEIEVVDLQQSRGGNEKTGESWEAKAMDSKP